MIRAVDMTEKAHTIEDHPQEPINVGSERKSNGARAVSARRRGRPRGTSYRGVDAALHDEMRRLLEKCAVPSLTAAARSVVGRAYGSGSRESKVTRLVRTYRH